MELGGGHYAQRSQEQPTAKLVTCLERLGYTVALASQPARA